MVPLHSSLGDRTLNSFAFRLPLSPHGTYLAKPLLLIKPTFFTYLMPTPKQQNSLKEFSILTVSNFLLPFPPKATPTKLSPKSHFGRLRQVDHLRPGIRDQPGKRGETPSPLKIQKLAAHGGRHKNHLNPRSGSCNGVSLLSPRLACNGTISAHYNLHLPDSSNSATSGFQVAGIIGAYHHIQLIFYIFSKDSVSPFWPALWEVKAGGLPETRNSRSTMLQHSMSLQNNFKISWALWRTPVVPATQEAEPGGSLESKKLKKTGWSQWLTPVIPALCGAKAGRLFESRNLRTAWATWQNSTSIKKQYKNYPGMGLALLPRLECSGVIKVHYNLNPLGPNDLPTSAS
ncbi:Zinc finger protein [Plecturocebus cupreus]